MIRTRAPQLRTKTARTVGIVGAVAAVVAASAVSLAAPAQADDSSTLTVVGTSDVFDSNLVQAVLKPGFEAYYKARTGNDITLNYVSKGTGDAIKFAEAGTASAMLVHAASLENQFVDQGFSAEKYGRAIFFGDYVLLAPPGDPAHVLDADGNPSHDMVTSFQKIAAAGAAHKARFVSRGKTPGTTVQEHAIWKLTDGVPTCTVSAANGGGTSPSTDTGDCADPVNPPPWYHITGLTQGPNILNADACNYSDNDDTSHSDCYVFTDRGTFQYLRSQSSISQLKIVGNDNSTDARGGANLLINSFHAYAISAQKFAGDPNVQINSAGAKRFLDWVTSPAGQAMVADFLSTDPDGAPFLPSASPTFTYTSLPAKVKIGSPVKITGTLRNVVPGTPTLSGETVTLSSAPLRLPSAPLTPVGTATTNAQGGFTFSYTPGQNRRYGLSVGAITKVEIPKPTLDPEFGDLLAPASLDTTPVNVVAQLSKTTAVNNRTGHIVVSGNLAPKVVGPDAHVSLYLRKFGTSDDFRYVALRKLAAGAKSYKVGFTVPKGTYQYEMKYYNPDYFVEDLSTPQKLAVN